MSAESPSSLTLTLGASRSLTAILVCLHAGAAVLVLVTPLSIWLRAVLLVAIGIALYRSVALHGSRQHSRAVVVLMLAEKDACAIRRNASTEWEWGHIDHRWVQPWLAILSVALDGQRWPVGVVVWQDAAPPDAFRRLRVRLRLRTEAVRE